MARAVAMKLISRKRQNYGLAAGNLRGINYSGFKIPEAKRGDRRRDRKQPVFYWKDLPAVSGMVSITAPINSPPVAAKNSFYWRAER